MKLQNCLWLYVLVMCIFLSTCYGLNTTNYNFYLDEVQSLSELPLDRLIKIKSSLSKNMDDYDFGPEARLLPPPSFPMAMPLKRMGQKTPIRRHEEWDEKGKDSKISKIFQLTVTALSFLAFGGYLLTLIITAIKRNQNNGNNGNVIVLSNLQGLQKIKRPKRGLLIYDPAENDYDMDHLYRGMLMLSSEYSDHYHR